MEMLFEERQKYKELERALKPSFYDII